MSEQDEGLAEHSQPARAVPWRGITIILAVVSLALILLGIVFYFIQTRMDPAHAAYGFVTETWLLLDAGAEYTLPTWLASMLWGSLGIAAGVAARNARYRRVGWTCSRWWPSLPRSTSMRSFPVRQAEVRHIR